MEKGDKIKRVIRQEAARTHPWNGAVQLHLCSQLSALLQDVCARDKSGSGNSGKSTQKGRGGKKKKALESGVCGNRARKPFISELVIQNIKNPIS